MTFPISPGVYSREIDKSASAVTQTSTNGSFIGKFTWGPVLQVTRVSSESDLLRVFGKPTTDTNVDFLQAVSFLAYSNALDIVRIGKEVQSKNAVTGGTAPSVLNDEDYDPVVLTGINYLGKYTGAYGNSLQVQTCDSTARFESVLPGTWIFPATRSNTITYTPQAAESLVSYFNVGDFFVVDGIAYTTTAVNVSSIVLDRIYGGSNSPTQVLRRWAHAPRFAGAPTAGRVHIVVVDTNGVFGDAPGSFLEKFENVSSVTTDKNPDGTSAHYLSVLEGSSYIRAGALGITGINAGTKVAIQQMTGGVDDFANIDTDERLLALDLFQSKELTKIGLFIAGDVQDAVVANYLIQNILEVRKDGLAFFSPKLASVRTAANKAAAVIADRATLPNTSYAMFNNNWKYMFDRYNDVFVWVPCAADEAGIYARVDRERDPWYAAAGIQRGAIKNVVKLAWNASEPERDSIYARDVNPIVDFPSSGPVVYGQKTLLGVNTALSRANVRRMLLQVEGIITDVAGELLFNFNDEIERTQFKSKIDSFLTNIKGRRGLSDFLVVCDETVNTPFVVQNNQFVGQIFLKPAYVTEFVRLDFVIVNASVSFEEVVGTV